MKEIWKDIKGYEGIYQISNLGNVKSLTRKIDTWYGKRITKGKILKPLLTNTGYLRVDLKSHQKDNYVSIHRLVAETFIPNPNNYPVVNHKDNNPLNNVVDNLEWCTQSHNIKYAYKFGRAKPVIPKYEKGQRACTPIKVLQYSLNNEFMQEYSSIKEASIQTKTSPKGISLCCRNLQKTANNFYWRYADK